mmetsp:Transcript_83569/g.162537  ORF Transcript_83569/g.162537 Transcript_83569/m.162537 type:complete len:286 (+) Transcript_83569:92-949(+)
MTVLENVDDMLSMFLFRLRLPDFVTWIYAIPACFFGIPAVIGGPLLCFAGSSVQEEVPFLWNAWGGSLLIGYVVLFYHLVSKMAASKDSTERDEARRRAVVLFDFQMPLTFFSMVLAYKFFPPAVIGMQYFAFSSLLTQILIVVVKRGACRTRPCIRSFSPSLPVRCAPLSLFVSSSKYAMESFPSGDAAEAVVFAATLFRYSRPLWLCVAVVLLSASGRVFFHAHHFGDVFAGIIIATITCTATSLLLTTELEWWVLVAAVGAFVGSEKTIRAVSAHWHDKEVE